MIIRQAQLTGIATGTVTLAFRRWRSPTVKTGGTLRTSIGVLAIDSVEVIEESEISEACAIAAGSSSRQELVAELAKRAEGKVYRIRLRLAGPDPRQALREQSPSSDEDHAEILRALSRLDRSSRQGAWTQRVLGAIRDHPGVRAGDLATALGLDKIRLKTDVRKLKELGLTESLEVGYRLSPRGRAVLAKLG